MENKIIAIKAVIRSILVSNAFKNLSLDELSRQYYEFEGDAIPFRKFGYTNLYDFLKSMPDVVEFIDKKIIRGVTTDKTDHIKKLVANQRVPRKKPNNRRKYASTSQYYSCNYNYQQQQKRTFNQTQNQYQHINVQQYYQGPVVYQQQQPQPIQMMQFGHQYMNVQHYHQPAIPPPPAVIYGQTQFRCYQQNNTINPQNNTTNNQQSIYNTNISAIPNVVEVPKVEVEAKKDEEKVQKKVAFGETSIIEEKGGEASDSKSIDLIDLDNSPVPAEDLDEDSYNVNNFNNIDLNASILDIGMPEMENGLPKALADLKLEDNDDQFEGKNDPLEALDKDPLAWTLLDFPIITSTNDRIIEENLILAKDRILRIFVTQTFSPSRFWFNNGDVCYELDQMMAEIEKFYSQLDPDQLRIPEEKMEPGLTCAAIYGKIFHRAEIISTPQKGKVRIYYVDFGTNEIVSVDKIRYLIYEFSHLPRQALRGCCDSIEPYDSDYWGWDAINQFHTYVREKAVWAQVIKYCPKSKIYRLALIDNNIYDEIHINKMMIIKKYAKLVESKMWIHGNCLESVGPFCYHFPTFDTLEQTDYPGYCERGKFYIDEAVEYYLLEELYNLFMVNPNIARNKKYSYLMTKEHIPIIRRIRKILGMPLITNPED